MKHEPIIRLGVFLAVLLAAAIWEVLLPRRQNTVRKSIRWLSNLGLVVINTIAQAPTALLRKHCGADSAKCHDRSHVSIPT